MSNMQKLYLQACYDCEATPKLKHFKQLKRKQKEEWTLQELTDYRNWYDKEYYYDL